MAVLYLGGRRTRIWAPNSLLLIQIDLERISSIETNSGLSSWCKELYKTPIKRSIRWAADWIKKLSAGWHCRSKCALPSSGRKMLVQLWQKLGTGCFFIGNSGFQLGSPGRRAREFSRFWEVPMPLVLKRWRKVTLHFDGWGHGVLEWEWDRDMHLAGCWVWNMPRAGAIMAGLLLSILPRWNWQLWPGACDLWLNYWWHCCKCIIWLDGCSRLDSPFTEPKHRTRSAIGGHATLQAQVCLVASDRGVRVRIWARFSGSAQTVSGTP